MSIFCFRHVKNKWLQTRGQIKCMHPGITTKVPPTPWIHQFFFYRFSAGKSLCHNGNNKKNQFNFWFKLPAAKSPEDIKLGISGIYWFSAMLDNNTIDAKYSLFHLMWLPPGDPRHGNQYYLHAMHNWIAHKPIAEVQHLMNIETICEPLESGSLA